MDAEASILLQAVIVQHRVTSDPAPVDAGTTQHASTTSTPMGREMFQLCGVFAEFERSIVQERMAGLERARLLFLHAPLAQACRLNGLDSDATLVDEDLSCWLICEWYVAHREAGGEPAPGCGRDHRGGGRRASE